MSELKAGKYQAYPEHKDSGVEWLSEIPAHWKTCRLKHLASIKNGQDYKAVQSESGYPVMGSGGQFAFATEFMYDKSSVLLGRKGTIDKPLFIDVPFWTVDTMYYTEMLPNTNAKYLYYLATTIQFTRYSTNTALPSMTQEHLGNYIFAVPVQASERVQIAHFLDHETAKIDTLIEKQQQLIKLLKEKRQAVISHAVTKGLSPQAPMKDSGVEWLGEVPAHWVVVRLKQVIKSGSSISYGIVQPGDALDEGVPFIQTTNISQGNLALDDLPKTSKMIESNYPRSRLSGGEVILGIRASIGAAYVVPVELRGVNLSRGVARIQPNSDLTSEFLVRFFQTNAVDEYWGLSKQGSTFSEVSIETVRELKVVIPPETEQRDICLHIEQMSEAFERIINLALMQHNLQKERRTALISAAVTGKIDVRNWEQPND
ncbi:restriction endonuclease subunit S [Pseudoalteromonas sp. APC 3224]|uniref:restriction endonuclease subunit S n=1 Tax=Pseudoalteromonas sp. APC 3224 TaxID=3035203 RepID=UPI0025B4609E|nr:restriction endonuclease subunit S [Pseudoalteromonas sp. APC 3224]MDN3487172.1 restriction endonuclease subunit S [Pseudoalteromonas sp. APC 3224]